MKVREMIDTEYGIFDEIRDIEILDFKTNKRLAIGIKNAKKYLNCEVKDYDYYDTLGPDTYFEYVILQIFI